MAIIGNAFDLEKALQSQGYAYKCWFNYNKDGNTMRISDADMKTLTDTWRSYLANWEANAERDVTEYSIEGSLEWNEAIDDGKAEAKEAATKDYTNKNGKTKEGWGGSVTNSKNRNVANGVTAGVGAVGAIATTAVSMSGVVGMTTTISGVSNVPLGFVIAAPLELAIGVLYEATFPNRKENIALKELKSLMETGQSNMQAASLQMEQADLEMTQLTTASEQDKQTTEEQIAQKQELIKTAQAIYNAIVARVKSGESLSATDNSKLQACKAQIGALQEEINALQLGSIDFSTANSEAIEAKKGEFDTHAQSIAKEKGITEYAATFDEATNEGAKAQIAVHSLNFAASVLTTVQAAMFVSPFTLFALAFVAMAAAGAGMSAHAIVEQSMILADTNKELETRGNTEDVITNTTTDYENKLSNMFAQGDIVNEGLGELNEFEQENVVLENVPTSSSENETGAGDSSEPVTTKSSFNPFANNDNNQNNKKNLFAQ